MLIGAGPQLLKRGKGPVVAVISTVSESWSFLPLSPLSCRESKATPLEALDVSSSLVPLIHARRCLHLYRILCRHFHLLPLKTVGPYLAFNIQVCPPPPPFPPSPVLYIV